MNTRALVASLCLGALTAACDRFPATPPCETDEGCGAGYRCDPDTRDCVPGEAALADKTVTFTAPAVPKVDFLFVIDNSGSMCEEQAALADGFAEFARALMPAGESPMDFRLAFVTTDLRTETDKGRFVARPVLVPSPNCSLGDAQIDPGCDALVAAGPPPTILASAGAEKNIDDFPDFARKFQCLARLGTLGDGFEMGLEAMRLALSCEGPNAEALGECCSEGGYNPACVPQVAPAFLRPDAVLAVVVLSDEDDCSDPSQNPAASLRGICRRGPADTNGDGVPDGYDDADTCPNGDKAACFERDCGARSAEVCHAEQCVVDRGDNNNCEWHRDALTPVDDYVAFLRGLKADPGAQLLVTTIVGERALAPDGQELSFNPPTESSDPACVFAPTPDAADPDPARCCPRGRCVGANQPGCQSEYGVTFPGKRYLQFSEAFGAQGLGCPRDAADGDCVSLCRDPVATTAAHFRRLLVSSFPSLSTFCLDERPACRVEGKRCVSTESRQNPENYAYSVRVKCDSAACDADFEPLLDAASTVCESGLALTFGKPVPRGATVQFKFAPDIDPAVHIAVPEALPLAIPDEGAVESRLTGVVEGHVLQAAIHVTITHGERSDLKLILRHGDKSQTLYAGTEKGEDLERVFDAADFAGVDATGEWTLEVADEWPLDTGRLERWALELKLDE